MNKQNGARNKEMKKAIIIIDGFVIHFVAVVVVAVWLDNKQIAII